MELEDLRREIKRLRLAMFMFAGISIAALMGAARPLTSASFDQITLHRLNLVDNNGTLRLVIANKDNYPPILMHGKADSSMHRDVQGEPATFIFYNAEGDEQGGWRWDGHVRDGKYSQMQSLTLDQFQGNEMLELQSNDQNGSRCMGLNGIQQPDTTAASVLSRQFDAVAGVAARRAFARAHFVPRGRLFTGYCSDGDSIVALSDGLGRVRLQLVVKNGGAAALQFLDSKGNIEQQFPAVPK